MSVEKLSPWKRFIGLIELDRRDVLQVLYYAVFAGLVSLTLPLGIQAIINLIQGAQVSTSWIVLVVLVTLGTGFVGILQLMQMRIIENIQQKIFTRSSFEFAYRFPKIKLSELRDVYPPELANRFFDTLTVQKSLSKVLLDFPAAFLQVILGLVLLSFYHPFFIVYGLLLVILIYVVFRFTAARGLQTSLEESKNKYKVAHWLQEIARSIISFKLSGTTSHAIDKNDALVYKYLDARESHFRILIIQFLQMTVFKVLVTAGLLLIGGLLVLNQEMNIGQFVAAEIIILLVISSVEKLITGLETFYDLLTSLEKLGQVVDKELEHQSGQLPFNEDEGFQLELENVSYTVPERSERIVDGVNLRISPSCMIILHGPSGSGKTTLLRLIAGLYEPSEGQVFVNNVALKGIQLSRYRGQVGQSFPGDTPFEGTLLDNITFGNPNISEKDVYWALENTGLTDFVRKQPDGIYTVLHPEGQQIPSTVAKKIMLARSIVKRPKLLILKDPLLNFTKEESLRIMDFITDPSNGWALVVVSENIEWVTRCTRSIFMDKGKITEN